jgi:hypothetical protein
MSAGAVAGIMIASVVLAGVAFFLLRRLRKNGLEMMAETPTAEFESTKEAAAVRGR